MSTNIYKLRQNAWTCLKLNGLSAQPSVQGNDKTQLARQQIANKDKELELEWVKDPKNSLGCIREALLNNQEVFTRLFVDDTLFSAIDERQFFDRLNCVFKEGDACKDSLQKRQQVEQVIAKVTENQDLKQLINQQLEKTKVLKNKLDDVKDELFSE